MRNWTKEELIAKGYKIENAQITSVDLSMADHGVLTLAIGLNGDTWGCIYGGYILGYGYLGADEFDGSADGIESIMRIMNVVGVERFNNMKNEYVRVATKGWGSPVKIIGHITKDKWFDIESFFKDKKVEHDTDLNERAERMEKDAE